MTDDPRFEAAQAAYARGNEHVARGEVADAVHAFQEAQARLPGFANALNYAGFLLTTRGDASDRKMGIELLRRALTDDPDNAFVLPNLANALVAEGREDEAIAACESFEGYGRKAARALNWLGWNALRRGEPARAEPLLERAVRMSYWFGAAHSNLGAARVAQKFADAASSLATALACEDLDDVVSAFALLGASELELGRARRGLWAVRRAAHFAATKADPRAERFALEVARIEADLRAAKLYFPSAVDELDWISRETRPEARAHGVDAAALATTLAKAEHRVKEARAHLDGVGPAGDLAREVLDRIASALAARALVLADAGLPYRLDDALVPAPARASFLAATNAFSLIHLALYRALLAHEVERSSADPFVVELSALLEAGMHGAALERFEQEARKRDLFDLLGVAEREGERARIEGRVDDARRFFAIARDSFAAFASGATSGGEGLARMLDVTRMDEKLAALKSP